MVSKLEEVGKPKTSIGGKKSGNNIITSETYCVSTRRLKKP